MRWLRLSRFSRFGHFVVVAFVVGGIGAVAHAQPDTRSRREARERALDLYEESRGLYDRGDVEEAAALLRRAYRIFPEPVLLYNLGRCLEHLGDTEEAVAVYRRYLDQATDVEDRGRIERRIAELTASPALAAPLDPPTAPLADPPPEPPPEPPAPLRDPSPAPWIVAGVGVLALAAAPILFVVAENQRASADAAAFFGDAVDQYRAADALLGATHGTWIGGLAIALAGALWGTIDLLTRGPQAPPARAAIAF